MAYIAWLHRDKLARETAGGKGASLSDLLSAGFAVDASAVSAVAAGRRSSPAATNNFFILYPILNEGPTLYQPRTNSLWRGWGDAGYEDEPTDFMGLKDAF